MRRWTCHTCQVLWSSPDDTRCWVCGEEGERAQAWQWHMYGTHHHEHANQFAMVNGVNLAVEDVDGLVD